MHCAIEETKGLREKETRKMGEGEKKSGEMPCALGLSVFFLLVSNSPFPLVC